MIRPSLHTDDEAFNLAVEDEMRVEGIDEAQARANVIQRAKLDRENEQENQCG